MARYALAHHVFVCVQDEHVVFLDVRQDRYFMLEAEQARALRGFVRGWPLGSRPHAADAKFGSSNKEAADPTVVVPLVQKGLLMTETAAGKDATPIQFELPVEELSVEAYEKAPQIGAVAVFRFIKAASGASLALRLGRFDGVIDKACHRRRERELRGGSVQRDQPFDRAKAHDLVATFVSLRPFFYSAKNACLFESLALGKFLASYHIHPHWVFGVQARPFAAHCWLQQDGVVLNDTVEYVSRYTPIMVV